MSGEDSITVLVSPGDEPTFARDTKVSQIVAFFPGAVGLQQNGGQNCYAADQTPPPGTYTLRYPTPAAAPAGRSAPRLDSTLDGSIQFLKTLGPALPAPPALAAAHDSIHNALWGEPAWQLPVLDAAYPGLAQRLGPNFLQKYSENCHAPFDFAVHVTNRLAKPMSAGNTDEICVAGWVDKFFWDTFEMVAQACQPACFKRKRNQSNPSASALGSGSRPDFSILVWNSGLLAMLFVGEDKALDSDIAAAYSDLIRKAPEVWGSSAYSDKIEFLVAYAAAGSRMRLCLLPRMRALIGGLDVVLPEGLDLQSTPLIPIGRELNLESPEDVARLMLAVPAIHQIVSAQMPHLRAGHGSFLEKVDTMLHFRPPIVTKYVPLAVHPHLQGELQLLTSVYKRLTRSGAKHVITLANTVKGDSPSIPAIKDGWYRVAMQPVGVQLSGVPSTISAATRFFTHILLGLKELAPGSPTRHYPDVCHGDLRPENVILCGDHYRLCDLEGAIKLDDPYSKARHGPNRQAWGPHREAWVDGKFVIQSDLWAVGKMVATACDQIQGFGAAGGTQLAQQLLDFQFTSHDDVLKVLSKISP